MSLARLSEEVLPHLNASFNALSTLLLVCGYACIRRRRIDAHRRCMQGAVLASAAFLVGYLTRVATSGTHRFAGSGALKLFYLVLLGSHMLLAIAVLPLVLRTLYLAGQRRFDAHRRIARVTWPIWLYVSLTGVIVYGMLYHM